MVSDQTIREKQAQVLEKMASEVVYMGYWPKFVLPAHEREALEAGAAALRGHLDEQDQENDQSRPLHPSVISGADQAATTTETASGWARYWHRTTGEVVELNPVPDQDRVGWVRYRVPRLSYLQGTCKLEVFNAEYELAALHVGRRAEPEEKEDDHGAGLIHQTIPDMAGTEPRPNSEDK